ncbi:hypothetical protein GCM10020254_73730 [Streptomyces goshikiensis]
MSEASVTSPWPGTTVCGGECGELVEHADPALAVHIGVVGREVRRDREDAGLQQIAGEQHPAVHEDDLVGAGVRGTDLAQQYGTAAEVDLGLALVDQIGVDQFDSFEFGGDRGAQALEHAEIAGSLAPQFGALAAVVDDRGGALERLRAEAVLRVEVGEGQVQAAVAGQAPGLLQHQRAVAGGRCRCR